MADTTPAKKAPAKKTATTKAPAKKSAATKAAETVSSVASAAAGAQTVRRVAILGGNRIPFARSNTVYANASNQDMLTAALDGLVDRFGLAGRAARRGRCRRGAQAQPRLQPDPRVVLGSQARRPRPRRTTSSRRAAPASQAAILVANKIALGQIESASPAASTPRRTRRSRSARSCARSCSRPTAPRTPRAALKALAKVRPGELVPDASRATPSRAPGCRWVSTPAITAAGVGDHPRGPGRARRCLAPEPRGVVRRGIPGRPDHAVPRRSSATRTCAPDSSLEKLAKLKPVFGKGEAATMTAANSTPLTDGASAVLLASEEWAEEHGLPLLAYFVDAETAAVDYVHGGEGLLMAPAYAVPRHARAQRADACRTSTSTRSTRRSPRRCSRR